MGLVVADEDAKFKCSLDGVLWEYKNHTISQLKEVLKDGKNIKTTILQKFNDLKNQIISIQDIEKLEKIKWSS